MYLRCRVQLARCQIARLRLHLMCSCLQMCRTPILALLGGSSHAVLLQFP